MMDAPAALFAQWEAEDGTDDPQEIEARIQEWEELKQALNANRAATGERPLFPALPCSAGSAPGL